ncbi:MAG: hypothetical protein GX640_19740, partial [Fibrobacter sp.]|nr:hypothetical protein [Fibrobacter sp.]
ETLPSLSFRPSYALLGEPTGGNLYYGRDGWIGIELNFSSDESERLNRSMEELNSFLIRSSSRYYSDCYDNKDVIVNKPVYSQLNGCKAQIRIIHRLRHKNESIRLLNQYREIARYICKPYRTKVCSVGVSRLAIDTALGSLTVRGVSFPWRTDPYNSFFEESYLALRTAQCRSSGGVWDNSRIGSCTSGDILTNRFNIPTVGYGPGNEQFDNADTDEVEQNLRDVFFGNAVIAHRLLVPPKNFTESDSSQG